MNRRTGLGTVVILTNIVWGVISFNAYQGIQDRITNIELHQKVYSESTQRLYDVEFKRWQAVHEKTVAKFLETLGVDGKYDFNNVLISKDSIKKFFNYQVYAKTDLLLKVPEELIRMGFNVPQEIKRSAESPAIFVGKYVLMTSHTNDAEYFKKETAKFETPQGILEIRFEFKVLDYKVEVVLPDSKEVVLKEIYRDREKDFSLFEIPKNLSPKVAAKVKSLNFPFVIGESTELEVGKFIYINGRPGFNSEVARPGFVTALFTATLTDEEVKKDNNEFGISQSTEQGDSGSPIIAFRDGRPELIGIYLGWAGDFHDNGKNVRSRALKINVAVDDIKEKTGINLRELQRQILSAK